MLVRPNGEQRLADVMANATLVGRIAAAARLSARRRREIAVSCVKARIGHE